MQSPTGNRDVYLAKLGISDNENSDNSDTEDNSESNTGSEEVGYEDKQEEEDDDNNNFVNNRLALIVYQATDTKTTTFTDTVLLRDYPAAKEGNIQADDSLVPTWRPLCSQPLKNKITVSHILAEVPELQQEKTEPAGLPSRLVG
ncbi:hypothetical protein BKA56DRAFT_620599 [Ilyonectria sp. MPI-CAGE-AT-0026]|nr:hypothetical protein BKA56DRAFT_620599 [Ilyonectria sp. MPI-CAGE-AT-0026]